MIPLKIISYVIVNSDKFFTGMDENESYVFAGQITNAFKFNSKKEAKKYIKEFIKKDNLKIKKIKSYFII